MVEPLVPVFYAFDGTVVDFSHLGESSGAVAFPVEVVQDVVPAPHVAQICRNRSARGIDMVAYFLQHGDSFARDILTFPHLTVEEVLRYFISFGEQVFVFGVGYFFVVVHVFYPVEVTMERFLGQAAHVVVGGAVVLGLVACPAGAHLVVVTVVEIERTRNDMLYFGIVALQESGEADGLPAIDAQMVALLIHTIFLYA